MSDRGIGVMLILRGPGGFAGGKASDALVSHIDLFPTICDVLEIGHPDWLQGRSLLPIVTGVGGRGARRRLRRGHLPRRLRAAAGDPHAALEARAPLRRPPSAGAAEHRRQPQQGRSGCGTATPSARSRRCSSTTSCSTPTRPATWSTGPTWPAVAADLGERLERWMRDTGDPLLDGPGRAAAGRRDQRSRAALRRRSGDRLAGPPHLNPCMSIDIVGNMWVW